MGRFDHIDQVLQLDLVINPHFKPLKLKHPTNESWSESQTLWTPSALAYHKSNKQHDRLGFNYIYLLVNNSGIVVGAYSGVASSKKLLRGRLQAHYSNMAHHAMDYEIHKVFTNAWQSYPLGTPDPGLCFRTFVIACCPADRDIIWKYEQASYHNLIETYGRSKVLNKVTPGKIAYFADSDLDHPEIKTIKDPSNITPLKRRTSKANPLSDITSTHYVSYGNDQRLIDGPEPFDLEKEKRARLHREAKERRERERERAYQAKHKKKKKKDQRSSHISELERSNQKPPSKNTINTDPTKSYSNKKKGKRKRYLGKRMANASQREEARRKMWEEVGINIDEM